MRTEVIPQEQRSQTNTLDYVLYLDFQVAGATEAKAEGTLTGIKVQTAKYATGLPDNLPATRRPLPFLFEPLWHRNIQSSYYYFPCISLPG